MGIEKIGLPAKPAAKGSSWVLDASSCQACQTPFSLFNRKHHCRRCGGLFCGTCTSSKVILRSQGDSAVRVCEPCKKLEEAARFQLRNRGKLHKGASRATSAPENEALVKEILGDHDADSLLSGGSELMAGEADSHHGTPEVSPSKDKALEPKEENVFPEKLRDEALEQKRIYATLKREGRNAEALQAFKRHKELTREAEAIEFQLKKAAVSHRRALAEGIASTGDAVHKTHKESPESAKEAGQQSSTQEKVASRDTGVGKKVSNAGTDDDLLNALKDLGWKEADLSEKKVKKGATSDMDLLAEISDSVPKEPSTKKPAKENPTQLEILAHKRRALALKREGKPAEAKEELKKAKMLERKLEEMALLEDEDEDEDDDDDELAALMRTLNKEAKMGPKKEPSFRQAGGDIPPLPFSLAEEDDDDNNVDVTDEDANDPSIIAALRSMGWEEEAATMERSRDPKSGGPDSFRIAESVNKESSLQSEILTHKRRALALKREGNVAEAKIELQQAKVLEQKLEALRSQPISSQPVNSAPAVSQVRGGGPKSTGGMRLEDVLEDNDDVGVEVDEEDMRDPEMMAALKAMGFEEEEPLPPLKTIVKPSPLEKKNLQDEILSIKRSALALKKQGKIAEAREELRQAKGLEQKLEKMQKDLEANSLPPSMAKKSQGGAPIPLPDLIAAGVVSEDEEEEVEVNADDFMDPDLVAALKSVGWQEQDTFVKDKEPEKEEDNAPIPVQQPYKAVKLPPKDHARKLQLQKDLLAHKRRALALKREGKAEEAKSELAKGKVLEKEMEEIDNAALNAGKDPQPKQQPVPSVPNPLGDVSDEDEDVTDEDMRDPELLNALKSFGWKPEPERPPVVKNESPPPPPPKVEKPKLNEAHPPYRKAAVTEPEPFVDPIWHAIMKSASINQNQVPDTALEDANRGNSLLGDHSFDGEHGERGSSADLLPPLFDHPSSVPDPPKSASGRAPTFDLLSGGAWDAPPPESVLEKDDSEEEEDDVFDAGLLAALQSVGLGPPSKPGSSVQAPEGAANAKRQSNAQQMQMQQSRLAGSARGQQNASVPDRTSRAEPVQSSAAPAAQSRVGADGRAPVPPQPAKSVSRDHVAAAAAGGPSSNSYAPAAGTGGGTSAPSLQDEIKMHKRKALALKRDGKTNEAREELRQAKILEKQMEMGPQSSSSSTEEHHSPDGASKTVSSTSSPEKVTQTVSPDKPQATPSQHSQTHKEQVRQELRQGKDRKKLQQESLAHKRKALGLRREGKTDEADAEFELAKALEKQMDDLDHQMGKSVAQEDMGMVEDLLDPQLMAALKGLGFNDGDLNAGGGGGGGANVNRVSAAPPGVTKSNPQPHPQAGQSSTNRPLHTSAVNAQETSHEPQVREGRSTPAASANRVKEEKVPNRTSQQPIQSAGGRSKAEEQVGQRRSSVPDGGRSGNGGAGSSSGGASQVQRKQLEDKIKREKVKAVELKRAGRQAEALEILRGAKRMEKELLAISS